MSAYDFSSAGMCHYHPNMPASRVCSRCGIPICQHDAKSYNNLTLCPQCYTTIPSYQQPSYPQPNYQQPSYQQHAYSQYNIPQPFAPQPNLIMPQSSRSIWGFLLSVVASILIILNAAALLSSGFYGTWTSIFPWIPLFGAFPPWILVAIGLILGIVIVLGSILMILGYGTLGAVVVFPVGIISLLIGGGFLAGFVLGIVGGIMGIQGR